MGSKLLWSESAKLDLKGILDYISYDSNDRALKVLKEIRRSVSHISEFPFHGRIVPELERQGVIRYREVSVSNWRIIYVTEEDLITVYTVIDGRRNVGDILMRRILR